MFTTITTKIVPKCAPAGTRTQDSHIKSVVLYLLSYERIREVGGILADFVIIILIFYLGEALAISLDLVAWLCNVSRTLPYKPLF